MNNTVIDWIRSLFIYSELTPLIFTAPYFWGFFIFVFSVFIITHRHKRLKALYLFLVSLFFYYKTSGDYVVLLCLTICSDFCIGHALQRYSGAAIRRLLLGMSIFLNLFILCYFKYAYFFADTASTIWGKDIQVLNYFSHFRSYFTGQGSLMDRIVLPVGISFYTFQAMSYTVDIYKRRLAPLHSIIDFGFYVSFFPQLVAGPIVRASEFIPQMQRKYQMTHYRFGLAVFMILTGLVKKMVFGDYMAVHFIDKVFEEPLMFPGFANLMAVLSYSLQVYLDFSGYTDMAIGIALIMGFRFNTNFNSPYKALNVGEFWKRWHISLSTWLRDYLYIPLGGNRDGSLMSYILAVLMTVIVFLLLGKAQFLWVIVPLALVVIALMRIFSGFKQHVNTNINLMLTMLLGGLWHGSTWNFIVWGGLNGLGLVWYKYWRKISPYEKWKSWPVRALKITITFAFISFTRIWFRAQDKETAEAVRDKIWGDLDWSFAWPVLQGYSTAIGLFVVGMIIHWLPHYQKRQYRLFFIKSPVWFKLMTITLVVLLIWQTISAELVPFIYFQF